MSSLTPELKTQIETELQQNPVVLFMKGEADSPMCGFSARAVVGSDKPHERASALMALRDGSVREPCKKTSPPIRSPR